MSKRCYRPKVEVDLVTVRRGASSEKVRETLEREIQDRYDDGWTFRGACGARSREDGSVETFLAYVRKEPLS